ncbi:MAG: response regulator [Myxococcota bacterium]
MPTVLIVDDSPIVRQQVKLALVPEGFELLEAEDGVQGLEMLETRSEIGLLICDVNMPNMNGLEMLEQMSGKEVRADLPIVMLTTEGDPALMKKAKQFGARGWIVKPFQAPMLVAAAKKLTLVPS